MLFIPVRYAMLMLLLWSSGLLVGAACADQVAQDIGAPSHQAVIAEEPEKTAEQEVTRLAMNDPDNARPTEKSGISKHGPILLVPLVLVLLALVAVSRRKEQEK